MAKLSHFTYCYQNKYQEPAVIEKNNNYCIN